MEIAVQTNVSHQEHKIECVERYKDIKREFTELHDHLVQQDADLVDGLRRAEKERNASFSRLYAMLWTIAGGLMVLLITAVAYLLLDKIDHMPAIKPVFSWICT